MNDLIELKLHVPESPSARDLVAAYAKNVLRDAEHVEACIFDTELAVANAQRIAAATREKAARLRTQFDSLTAQLEAMIQVEIAQ
jgi:hypothetical protein